jgi:hypothetical protein
MPIVLRQCKTKAGYEALPVDAKTGKWDQERRLNLPSVGRSMEALGYEVTDAGPLLVVKGKGICEATIYPTGRLMIKSNDEDESRATAERIYKDIGLEG